MTYKKTEHFEPIAMKCTRKQFESIEPILDKLNLEIQCITYSKNNDTEYYLTNNLGGNKNETINTGCDFYRILENLLDVRRKKGLRVDGQRENV